MATPASVVNSTIDTDQLQNPTAMCPAPETRLRNVELPNATAYTGVKSSAFGNLEVTYDVQNLSCIIIYIFEKLTVAEKLLTVLELWVFVNRGSSYANMFVFRCSCHHVQWPAICWK